MRHRFHRGRRPEPPRRKFIPTNENIRAPEVRVISSDGKQIGVMPTAEGIRLAKEKGLDLIEIVPNAQPPVCKIMDFGKYLYQTAKEEHKRKAHAHEVEVRGMRIGVHISRHDLEVKAGKAKQFLEKGDKVKVDFMLRGREKAHPELAKAKLKEFLDILPISIKIEQEPKRQPWGFTMIIGKAS
ncbi:MAG: translation initiation factor IF-3 [bacterium]|nr:translation initiation factor IF-3 [bacterium]